MTALLTAGCRDDAGATAIEYAVLAGFLALAIVGAISALGVSVNDLFVTVQEGFP